MEQRVYNFSAGPAALPLPVLEQAKETLTVYPGAGASVMELSHRSKAFADIHERAKNGLRTLLKVPDTHNILFVQGGASLQFSMIAMNFLQGSADYIGTGSWASKAISEAKKLGNVRVVWDGKPDNFNRMPKQDELDLDANASYLHFTSNETIQGIEFFTEPESAGGPLICDASSDILSRPIDVSKYGMIYAGAQKNVGPAGCAIVIVSDELLERVPDNLPSLLDYKLLADKDSLYNTPPCWTIYMISLVTQWLLDDMGGLDGIYEYNKKKANELYDTIDNSGGFYRPHAEKESRSIMNVAWRLPSEELEKQFIEEAAAHNLAQLKGHRSVGGIRASIYNAMPAEGVTALCEFMNAFKAKHA